MRPTTKTCPCFQIGVAIAIAFALCCRVEMAYGQSSNQEQQKFRSWQQQAMAGNISAQVNLANAYKKGKGTTKDLAKAMDWYRKAAEQGNLQAQNSLAIGYEKGEGVEKSLEKAAYWYRRAAERGYKYAQTNLGMLYEDGDGVEQDLQEAAKWYRKAAAAGNTRAKRLLGSLYQKGEGFERDFDKAIKLFREARTEGDERAQSNIDGMYSVAGISEVDSNKFGEWLVSELDRGTEDRTRAVIALVRLVLNGFKVEGINGNSLLKELAKELAGDGLSIDTKIVTGELFCDLGERGSQLAYEVAQRALKSLFQDDKRSFSFDQEIAIRTCLARAGRGLGDVNEAEVQLRKVLEMHERKNGKSSTGAFSARFRLADLMYFAGDHLEEITLLRDNIRIYESDPEHDEYMHVLYERMALAFTHVGEVEKAISFHLKALDSLDGKSDVTEVQVSFENEAAVHNLAWCYRLAGEFQWSRALWEKLLEYRLEKYGEEHNMTHGAMSGLAHTLTDQGETETALELFEKVEKSARKINDAYFIGDYRYAELLLKLGRQTDAEETLKGGLEARRKNFLDDLIASSEAAILRRLVDFYACTDQPKKAAALQEQMRKSELESSSKRLAFLSGLRRENYLAKRLRPGLQKSLNLVFKFRENNRIAALSAGWLLNGKSREYDVLAQAALLSSERLAPKVEELKLIRNRLAMAAIEGAVKDDARKRIADLESQQSKLESELANLSNSDGIAGRWKSIGAVMSSLPFGSCFVSFAKVTEYDFEKSLGSDDPVWGGDKYVAWIVPPVGDGSVNCVDLGPAEPIDSLVSKVRKSLAGTSAKLPSSTEMDLERELLVSLNELSKRVYEPIAAHVSNANELIISPDGALWSIPFEILRLEDKYLNELKRIRYLSSGRELVQQIKPYSAVSEPVVFADPNFDLSANEIDGTSTQRLSMRSARNLQFSKLGYSSIEAEAIVPLIERFSNVTPIQFLSSLAQEASFKNLHRPRVLAISTHGFFDSDKKISNPLLRCGIALAGANNREEATKNGKEDGILTGLEIVGTDLRGTELVVLSACETGVGEIQNGEGVAGLRQAFQLAGAQSVVSSLWEVEDGETARLMKLFFQNLANGMTKSEALRQAQLTRIKARRARHGAAHPFFWAAFTLTGRD